MCKITEGKKQQKLFGIVCSLSMESLQCFANLPSLKKLELYQIKLADRNISFLDGMENLIQFDFNAGMFTTEEIAHICAKYPHLKGCCLGPYEKDKE